MPIYAIDNLVMPAGSDLLADASAMTVLSVAVPTPGYDDGTPEFSAGSPHAWYKFTATKTADLIVDGLLSYESVGGAAYVPNLRVYRSVVGSSPTGLGDCVSISGIITTGQYTLSTTAGETYVMPLWVGVPIGQVQLVARVGDYGELGPWVQPADQTWAHGGTVKDSDLPVETADSLLWATYSSAGMEGHHSLIQALTMPSPVNDLDATICMWNKARSGLYQDQFWTGDGTGTDVPSTPTCNPSPLLDSSGRADWVGGKFQSSLGGFGFGETAEFFVYTAVQKWWITKDVKALGPTGGLAAPTPPAGGAVEYEAEFPALLGADAAPDEGSHQTTDITVQWRGGSAPLLQNAGGGAWGPRFSDSDSDDLAENAFVGGHAGPEDFGYDYTLPDFLASANDNDWTEVPEDVLAAAVGYEAAWDEQWEDGTDLGMISGWEGGLQWVGMFPEQQGPTPPAALSPGSPPENLVDIREDQFVAVRMHVRPPRYRFIDAPEIPDVAILEPSGTPDDVRRRFFG